MERSIRSSNRAASTTRSEGEILLVRISRDQSGKRSVPCGALGIVFPTSGIQGRAEAVVVRAVRGIVRVAVRRPAIRCVVVATATTVHAVRAPQDRSPPMVVAQNSETASFSRQRLVRKRSKRRVAAASSTR